MDKTVEFKPQELIGQSREEKVRRTALFVLALVMGATIPMIVFIPLMTKSRSEAMQTEVAHVTVNIGSQAIKTVVEPPDLSSLSQAPVAEETLEEFVRGQPILISKREFLTLGTDPRLYEPDFIPEVESDEVRYQESPSELSLNDAKHQRFRSERSRYDFQGGFRFRNPSRNIELGEAYLGYVQRSLGGTFAPKLQIIEDNRDILKGAAMQEEIKLDLGR